MDKKVFLIDDDLDDQEMVMSALQQVDGNVSFNAASNGVEGLEALRSNANHPDVILLDLNMPKLGGFEVLQQLKDDSNLRQIPVVIFSTSSNESDIAMSYSMGAVKFLRKPTVLQELIDELDSLLRTI